MQKMQILEFYTSLLALEEAAEISLVSGLMSGSVKG